MTLSFSTEINGKPNYLVEKIWKWLWDNTDFEYGATWYEHGYQRLRPAKYIEQENIHFHKPKLHTIRRDEQNRWKAGNTVHPVIYNRTPDRFQFAPDFKCTGTQPIVIEWEDNCACIKVEAGENSYRYLSAFEMEELAINDGFESIKDFFAYFNVNFEGKIIHWSDIRY